MLVYLLKVNVAEKHIEFITKFKLYLLMKVIKLIQKHGGF